MLGSVTENFYLCMMSNNQTMNTVSDHYGAELLRNLHKQYASAEFCDVGLQLASSCIVRAHRNVLSASSPYFHAMFSGGLKEAKSEVVNLEHIAASNILETLISFIYTGCIRITDDNAQDLLEAADMLELPHVVDACCQFLKQHLNELNCIGIYLFADAHSCDDLRNSAETYLLANFQNVVCGDEFLQLPMESLLHFLRSDNLCMESESHILEAALKWMMADLSLRRRHIYDVIDVVRLGLISSSVFDRTIASCTDPGIKFVLQKLLQDLHAPLGLSLSIQCHPRRRSRRMLYVVGGYQRNPGMRWSDSCSLSQVDCFDTFLRLWRTAPSLHCARSGASVTAVDGVIYAVGGESESMIFDSVERLEPALSSRWRAVESMTVPRCGAGICAVGKFLFVFGGWVGSEIGTSVEVYDSQCRKWSQCDTMRGDLRFSMGIAEYQGLIFLAGGLNELNVELRSFECYNPVTKQWTSLASMKTKRAYFGLVALNGSLYAVGGTNEYDGALASVEKYSIDQDTWTEVCAMSTSRAGVAVAAANGLIYAIGGRTSSNEFSAAVTLSSVECYNAEMDEWNEAGTMPISRCEAGIAVL